MKKLLVMVLLFGVVVLMCACGGESDKILHILDVRNVGDSKIILKKVVINDQVYFDDEMLLDLGQAGVQMGREYTVSYAGPKRSMVELTFKDPKTGQEKTYPFTFTDATGTGGEFFAEYMNGKIIYKHGADDRGVIPIID